MIKRKEDILKLRQEGKSYKQIAKILKCSTSIISYHCSDGQKEKTYIRKQRMKKQHPYVHKLSHFNQSKRNSDLYTLKQEKTNRRIYEKLYIFNKKDTNNMISLQDVLNKLGENPTCYLTGEKIDIHKTETYQFDHIIPSSKGGDNSIDNLGICTKQANQCKNNLTPEDFIELCIKILKHNNYSVFKN